MFQGQENISMPNKIIGIKRHLIFYFQRYDIVIKFTLLKKEIFKFILFIKSPLIAIY